MIPANAFPILAARLKGQRPADPIVVSFVGKIGWKNPQVLAEPGIGYDWHFLHDLPVYVAVKPGLDCRSALEAIYREAMFYVTVADMERRRAGSLIGPHRLWAWSAREEAELFW